MSGFRFKQFEIKQDRCAMKVGTDGVLLGAWADGGTRILDIGSGTGLISLMMAQRFVEAHVVGIDMDDEACQQACENVAASPFRERVRMVHARLQDFSVEEAQNTLGITACAAGGVFDAIVSNPPFFVDSMKNPDNKRAMARHTDTLPFRDLLKGVKTLLSKEGVFSVVLPKEVVNDFETEACISGLYLVRKCAVKTVENKLPKRYLLAFSRQRKGVYQETTEVMMDKQGKRSEWYEKITDEFYL